MHAAEYVLFRAFICRQFYKMQLYKVYRFLDCTIVVVVSRSFFYRCNFVCMCHVFCHCVFRYCVHC